MIQRGVISKVRQYYIDSVEYSDEIFRAVEEFLDKPDLEADGSIYLGESKESLFNEWLTYDFRFSDGKSMLEKFYQENPLNFPEYRRSVYKSLTENYYGFFEVLEVRLCKGLTIKRLSDGKVFDVSEVSATLGMGKQDVFVSRVAYVGNHYELVGCDTKVIKLSGSEDKKQNKFYLETVFPKIKMETPKDAVEFFMKHNFGIH